MKPMTETHYLDNQFIIAMPTLTDNTFSRTAIYLCQHNADGALGIVINRKSDMKLKEIFMQMDISISSLTAADAPVYVGGPIQQERGFVLHTTDKKWAITLPISETMSLTTSRDIIEAIAKGEGPERYFVALGYAGWGKGQLEQEMLSNSWLNTPFGEPILFDTPTDLRWRMAASQIGIDIQQLTVGAGHA
jgi:putative transcriptional regulator